jgi:chromosome segregation ATPase
MAPAVMRLSYQLLAFSFLLLFNGCAHKARRHTAPDSSALQASGKKLGAAVTVARETTRKASAAVTAAKAGHDRETAQLAIIEPKVADLLRAAPPALRPLVEAVQSEVLALKTLHAETASRLELSRHELSNLTAQLETANAARLEVEKLTPAYFEEVNKLAARANTAEEAWAKNSREIVKLRTSSWFTRIAAGVGVLLLAVGAFLIFTGRLAIGAAKL